jgi:xanthine dehydrogenase FAD-binding subunit
VTNLLPKFDYYAPETLDEAVQLLAEHKDSAKVLAGGTDFVVNLRARLEHVKHVVDIKRITELQQITFDEKNGLSIGAAASLNKIIHDEMVSKLYPVIAEAAGTIADYEIRNRATLVGNICNASPAADTAPALLILDSTVNTASVTGQRKIPLKEFFAGVKKTNLKSIELVTSVTVPIPPENSQAGYLKARRTTGEDVAVIGVGGLVAPNGSEGKHVRLAYASLAPTPVRAYDAERIFAKRKPINQLLDEAMPAVMKVVSPISDVRAGKEYRAHLVRVLTTKLIRRLWGAS